MVNRQTQLSSGGTVLVRESVLRGSGPQGPQGPRGVDGIPMTIKGIKPTFADLQAMTGTPQLGHNNGWIADDTGILYVWYRNNPDSASNYTGTWTVAGRMRGNPGYLNSVGARCVETESDVDTSLLPEAPVVLKWDMAYLDTEEVPIVDSGTGLLANQIRPIVAGVRAWDGTNAVSTIDFDRIQPMVPPAGELSLDYPMGSSVFMVNIAVDFQPTTALVPNGVASVRLFWVPDAATRTLVAEQKTYVTDKEATLELSTFIKGADGGQYEVEVQSNVPGMLETRRWKWVRAGGGPGPQGEKGNPGAPARVHASSPLGSTTQLQTTTGAPGEYIMAGNKMFGWQETSPGSGTYGWKELGVIQGPPGNANTGFSDFDGVRGEGEGLSSLPEAGYPPLTTNDQNAPYPNHEAQPRIPFYIKALAEWVDRKIVSKFASATERSNIRPEGLPGEVSWVGDGTAAARGLDVYSGDHGYLRIPTVIVSTDTAPVGLTNHPDGTLWIQVQS